MTSVGWIKSLTYALIALTAILAVVTVRDFLLTNPRQPTSSTVPLRSASQTSAPEGLGISDLANSRFMYASGTDYRSGETQQFMKGQTVVGHDKGISSLSRLDTDHVAYADLNNDGRPDAVVIISRIGDALSVGGSSSNEVTLNVVTANSDLSPGSVLVLANAFVGPGNFFSVDSVTIRSGVIVVTVEDQRTAPSTTRIWKFVLDKNQLVEQERLRAT